MSKILRRPMFRGGGKVSSYGNGIATGLADGYEKGGQIGGGVIQGKKMSDGRYGFAEPQIDYTRFRDFKKSRPGNPVYTPESIKATLGGSDTPFLRSMDNVGLAATNIFNKYIGNTLENLPENFGNYFYGEDNVIEPYKKMTLDEYRDSLPRAEDRIYESTDPFTGETRTINLNDGSRTGELEFFSGLADAPERIRSDEASKSMSDIISSINDQESEKEIIEEQITDSGEKQKSIAEILTDQLVPKPIERGMEEERMNREELIQREKNKKIKEAEAAQLLDGLIDDDFSGMGDGLTDEERVKKSKALYKKLLSGDRSPLTQDLSDWALSLFEKSTKEGATVKSMLGEVAGEISKKPSRTETLDRDASKIAIQDFMMSKKAKADAEAFKGKTDYQYKLKSYYDKIGSDPRNLSWDVNKQLAAKAFSKGPDNAKVIEAALQTKTGKNVLREVDVSKFQDPEQLQNLTVGLYVVGKAGDLEVIEVVEDSNGNKTAESRANKYYI
jgi:hypothetical protein